MDITCLTKCKRPEAEVPDRLSDNEVRQIRQKEMPRDRIELSTPGFSDQCSTTELPRHYLYIILNFMPYIKCKSLFMSSSRKVSVRDISRYVIPRTTTLRGDEGLSKTTLHKNLYQFF